MPAGLMVMAVAGGDPHIIVHHTAGRLIVTREVIMVEIRLHIIVIEAITRDIPIIIQTIIFTGTEAAL